MPRVHVHLGLDSPTTPIDTMAPWRRLARDWGQMARAALKAAPDKADWLLVLDDDLDFHPKLRASVESWEVLKDPTCGLASLFNPGLRAFGSTGSPRTSIEAARSYAADPATFFGSQALLIRPDALEVALEEWDMAVGTISQRLVRRLASGDPVWVHRPSLVQHAADGALTAPGVLLAADFDPAWQPPG
jgi:hypothetical protein